MKEILSNKVAWIDLTSPSHEELDILQNELKIPQAVIDQIKIPSNRNKMEFYKEFFYAVLYFPIWNEETKTSQPVELDIIVFKNYIITIKYCDLLVPLNEFIENCEICNKEEKEKLIGQSTFETFYHIVQSLLEFSRRQLRHIEEKTVTIEESIFKMKPSKNNKKIIYNILSVKRDILAYRRIFLTLQNSLVGLDYKGEQFWGNNSKPYLLDLINDANRIWNNIEHHNDFIDTVEETFYTLINNNTNSLTRVFTIISFIAWPTLLIISWYQTNTNYLPFVGRPFDSYIVFLLSLVPSFIIYLFLKKNKLI